MSIIGIESLIYSVSDLTECVRFFEDFGLARDPDPFATIRQDIETLGIVGESDSALLVYLAYTSRLLDDPMSLITRGKLATGKSTLLKRVGVLMPPDAKIEAMEMTPAAWFNTPPDFFQHKVFIAGES